MRLGNVFWAAAVALGCAASGRAGIVITEVDPSGSGTSTYTADWFELTNTGVSTVGLSGWSMDDNSFTPGTAPLVGVSSIAPGQSVVFIDGGVSGTSATDATLISNFEAAWFGSNVPAGFTIGTYHGAGVGLSTTGDEVNIFDGSNTPVTGVSWTASTTNVSLDNSVAQVGAPEPTPRPALTVSSVAGVNGAFTTSETVAETGSPGTIGTVVTPEPTSLGVVGLGAFALMSRRRKIAR